MDRQGTSKRIGDPCPNCRRKLQRLPEAFRWQGKHKDGAYCEPCEAVWPIKGEEIEPLKHVSKGRE